MNTISPRARGLLIAAGALATLGFVSLLVGVIGEMTAAFQGGVGAFILALALAGIAHLVSNRAA